MSAHAFRLWHTLRYLRPSQVVARALRLRRPRVDDAPAPPVRSCTQLWVTPPAAEASLLGPTKVRFLNETGDLDSPASWNDPRREKLWLYNAHYFDDLCAVDAASRRAWHEALISRWIRENPPGYGNGWEPYPISRRVANWIKWALSGATLSPDAQKSLAIQVRWLRASLEYHLRGNHLLANARALVCAGAYFSGEEAERWLREGRELLGRQLEEQILADGGHFERSPMYQAIVLEDVLDAINALQAHGLDVPPRWKATALGMRAWQWSMCHADGRISFFNDAAFGIAAEPAQLEEYVSRILAATLPRPKRESVLLQPSGYVRLEQDDLLALIDCAPVGPDYIPGHAHADTLSFELSAGACRVFVNSGTSCYGIGPERLRQRGTAAHNTVEVDDENSSEVWHGFRVARRARPGPVEFRSDASESTVQGSHDGYRRLPGRNIHSRRWQLRAGSLTVIDSVSGPHRRAVARLLLHPEVEVVQADERSVLVRTPERGELHCRFLGADALRIETATWHPEFGRTVATRCISATLHNGKLETHIDYQRRA